MQNERKKEILMTNVISRSDINLYWCLPIVYKINFNKKTTDEY